MGRESSYRRGQWGEGWFTWGGGQDRVEGVGQERGVEEEEKGGERKKHPSMETVSVQTLRQEIQSKKQAVYDK